jgi:hypothetical protein
VTGAAYLDGIKSKYFGPVGNYIYHKSEA